MLPLVGAGQSSRIQTERGHSIDLRIFGVREYLHPNRSESWTGEEPGAVVGIGYTTMDVQ